jgi:CBS domain-containing protein
MRRTVQDVMTKDVVVAREETPFKQVVDLMQRRRVSALPVVDLDRRILGVVSENDLLPKQDPVSYRRLRLLGAVAKRRDRRKSDANIARDLMSHPAEVISCDAPLAYAARRLHERGLKRLFVVDADGRLIGVVSRRDVLKVFARTDNEIQRDVEDDVLRRTMWLPDDAIRVQVVDGIVTLEGRLERESLLPLLEELVRGVDGVVGVETRVSFDIEDHGSVDSSLGPWIPGR